RRELGIGRRTVRVMLYIVFTGPLKFHRNAGRLRNLDGFADKVRATPASESSAEIDRVDLNLLRRKPGSRSRRLTGHALDLHTAPDVAPSGTDVSHSV